jgi:hypothetical protein
MLNWNILITQVEKVVVYSVCLYLLISFRSKQLLISNKNGILMTVNDMFRTQHGVLE